MLIYCLWQAHIKSALIGASVNIPISNGRLATGTVRVKILCFSQPLY